MTHHETDYSLLERLASEFADRVRAGQRPSVEDYCARHPHVAADLREMLPPLAGLVTAREVLDAAKQPVVHHQKRLGDYLLLREIGRGGMGVVYEAEQVSLGRRVAIKMLPSYAGGPDLAARFEREARTAGRLHHTNIVPVFGVGRDGGTLFYVMQFIPGKGLDAVVTELRRFRNDPSVVPVALALSDARTTPHGKVGARTPPTPTDHTELPPPDETTGGFGVGKAFWQSVARVGVQVADALEYAHNQGVLHRDIKPSNLLLDPAGTVWVADFGLAKAAGQETLTADGALLGTLRYLPPEGLAGRSDARSDVYSLGLTLYELAALRPAYPEADRNVLLQQIGVKAPAVVTTLAVGIPRDLATVIHKAIEREPKRRYQTAGELAADLRRFLDGKPVRARWVGPAERAWRWCRQYPVQSGLMAGLALLAMTSVVAGQSALNDHRHLGNTEDKWADAEVRFERETARADAAEYAGRLTRAALFAAEGRADAAGRELEACVPRPGKPDLRGWEWDYLNALAAGRAGRRDVPPADGRSLGFAPGVDETVRAVVVDAGVVLEGWDGRPGRHWVRPLNVEADPTGGVSFDARGDRVLVATPAGVSLFEVKTAAELAVLHECGRPTAPVVLSADGHRAAVPLGDGFGVWDDDGKPVFRQTVPGVHFTHLMLSGDGRVLAAAGTRTVRRPGGREYRDQFLGAWNLVSGVERPAPPPPVDPVTALAFDPSGGLLAWASGPGRIGVWDANTGRPVVHWGAEAEIDGLVFDADGRRLAGVVGGVVRLWDAGTGAEAFALPAAAAGRGAGVRFGGDGRSLGVAVGDRLSAWVWTLPLENAGPPRVVRE